MIRKEECIAAVKAFRAKTGIEISDENCIATLHVMNTHGLDVHAALDQSSRGANDHGIDAWFYETGSHSLFVYQSKLSESKSLALRGLDDLSRARDWLERVIVEGGLDAIPSDNPCLFNLYRLLGETRSTIKKIHFSLASLFDENELEDSREYRDFESASAKSALNALIGRDRGGKLMSNIAPYNLERGIPLVVKGYPIEKIPDARLEFRHNAYLDLAYVPLHTLVTLYRQRGDVLFDKNVRLSLLSSREAKDRLVHPMEETLEAISSGRLSPAIFAFYHIGVTIAAASSAHEEANVVNLEAPSIINGCQTISIANEYLKKLEKKNDTDQIGRFKQIRIITKVVVGVSNEELKEITNCNNRQNPIENWQLFSNEPVHIEIESAFKDAGVFYERQKGKFDTVMRNAEVAKYYHATNGTSIKVVDLAQVIALARGERAWAAKTSEIFLNKASHDKIFDRTVATYTNDAIFALNLFRSLKRALNKYLELPAHANSNAPLIFKRQTVRMYVYQLAILWFYQRKDRRQARIDFASSLLKIASPRLVDDAQLFFQKIVTRIKNWYVGESKDFTIEVSARKMDAFFTSLATELGVDFDGPTPFTDRGINWRTELPASRAAGA
jgi:hypothetical protein